MKSPPSVSITVAAYNIHQWIEECLDSIVNQTFKDFECIVVDDCSRDITTDIIELYERKDSRIRLVRHDVNQGLSAVRKTGLLHSQGDYIWQIDGDDYLSYDALEKLIHIARNDGCDILRAGFMYDYDGKYSPGWQTSWRDACNIKFSDCMPLHVAPNGLWLNFIKKEFLDSLNFPVTPKIDLGEDFVFNSYMYSRAKKISLSTEVIYFYRRAVGSYTTGNVAQRKYAEEALAHSVVFVNWKNFPSAQMTFSMVLSNFRVSKMVDACNHLPYEDALKIIESYKSIYQKFDPEIAYAICRSVKKFSWSRKENSFVWHAIEKLHANTAEEFYDWLI